MPLPMMTSANDVMDIINYLATKPKGTTITDAITNIPRNLVEDRKLNSFTYWGVIKVDGDHIELDELGKDLNMIAPENRYLVFQKLIHTTRLYKLAVDWMFQKDFAEVTNIEVASFWHMNYKTDVGTSDEHLMKSMSTCFLQICEAAHFGSLSPGKMSKTTHFKIDKMHLGRYFTDTSHIFDRELKGEAAITAAAAAATSTGPPKADPGAIHQVVTEFDLPAAKHTRQEETVDTSGAPGARTVLFISSSRNKGLVEQIRAMLEVEKYNYDMASTDEISSILELVKVSSSMQKSNSGLIFVTSEESLPGEGGRMKMSPNKLIELGAALAVFKGRVVLIWDDRVDVPTVLQGLEIISYSGTELSLSAGANLMHAVNRFNNSP